MVQAITGGLTLHTFLTILFVLLATIIVGGTAYVLISKFLRTKTTTVNAKRTAKIVMYAIYAAGLFYAINDVANLNLTASLAAVGILGTIFLLPAIPLLQNLVSGIVLSVENNFREEDIIEFNGELCIVKDIFLRKTKLRSLSGKIIHVPNVVFLTITPVLNYTQGKFIKTAITLDIQDANQVASAKEIILRICTSNEHVLPNIPKQESKLMRTRLKLPINFLQSHQKTNTLQPEVIVKSIYENKITLKIHFWIWDIAKQEQIISEIYESIQTTFMQEKIPLAKA